MATTSELVSICLQRGTVPGCWTDPDTGETSSVIVSAAYDHNGAPIPAGTVSPVDASLEIGLLYLGPDGAPLDPAPAPADITLGPCPEECCASPECIESREWTFGIDNTGTRFNWDIDITVTLSDGSSFTFNQPPQTGWTPQITLWAAEMQAAMPWTVSEPRCDLPNGCGGLPGTPTGVTLPNMFWRYANVQVCPGDPIPVKAEITAVNSGPASKLGFVLASDGPIEGPLLTFRRCQNCGEDAVWFEEDGVTPVDAGLEPDCSWPCGLPPAPVPDALCQFDSQEGCDTTGSPDPNDWVSVVRIITICEGQEPQTNYYVEDTSDPEGGLLEYTIIDDFLVDCETGEPIPEPIPECDQGESWCRRVDRVHIDNHQYGERPLGMVLYRQDTFEIEVTLSDGNTVTLTVGPHASYPAQLDDIAAQMAAATGQNWQRYLQSADGDNASPFGNYAGADVCPGDVVPVTATATTIDSPSAGRIGRVIPDLLTGTTPGEIETLLRCQCCDPAGAVTWYDENNSVIDPPPEDCLSKSCDFPAIPVKPEPECEVQTLSVCEIQPEDFSDPDNGIPAVIITTDVFLNIITCADGSVTTDAFTLAVNGDSEPHELADPGNFYGDCDTLLPVDTGGPACPEDCTWTAVEWDIHAAAIDNNYWDGAGNNWGLIRPGWDVTFDVTLTDGTIVTITQVGGNGPTQQLTQWADQLMATGRFCNAGVYCDNWDRCPRYPNPNAPAELGWQGNTDIAFGNYLFVETCDPSAIPVSTIVTAATGPAAAALGATKTLLGGASVTATGYECVSCDGKFFLDCDGNPIAAPCCCTRPASSGSPLDCAITDCGGEATCAWGASPVEADAVFEAEEGGILWTFCDVEYQMPPGSYTLAEIQTWIAANTPHTAGIEPVDAKNVSFWFNLPCDCSGASFQIGDDDPIALAAIPEFDMEAIEGDGCALNVKLCGDPLDETNEILEGIAECVCEPVCEWTSLCDEDGTEWTVRICPDGEITNVVGVVPPGPLVCTTITTYCGNYGTYAGCDDLTSFTVDGTTTSVPANWATMSKTDRQLWLAGLFNTHATGASVTSTDAGQVCWTDVADRPIIAITQSSPTCRFLIALSVSIREVCSQTPGVEPVGEFGPCESPNDVLEIAGCADGIPTIKVLVLDGATVASTFYVQGDSVLEDPPADFTEGDCAPECSPITECASGFSGVDGAVISTPSIIGTQPSAGFAIIGEGNAGGPLTLGNIGTLPDSLVACLNEPFVDTLVDLNVPPNATSLCLNLNIVDVGQDEAGVMLVDQSTGLAYAASSATSSTVIGSWVGSGDPVGPSQICWNVPAGVDPANLAAMFVIVGGTITNDPDPALCDHIELVDVVSDAPLPDPECATRSTICGTVSVASDEPLEVVVVPPEPTADCAVEYLLGCDDVNGDGSLITLYATPIQTCYLEGTLLSTTSLNPIDDNGDEYTPVNPIVCDPATLDFDEEFYCDTAAGISFIRRTIVIAGQGAIVEEVTLDGTTPYTPTGVVQQGSCPLPTIDPDVEPCGTVCRLRFDGRFINLSGGFAGIDGSNAATWTPANGGQNLVDELAAIGIDAAYLGFDASTSDIQTVEIYNYDGTAISLGNGSTLTLVCEPRQAQLVKLCQPSTEFDIVTDEVCVDGAFATRYRGMDPSTGQLAGWERFEDGLGNEIPGPVTISDPCDCDCACSDGCAPEGCTDTQCGILRLDADPASLSQSTLESYTLEFTGTGFGAGCEKVNHPFTDETLTVVDVNGTNTVATFADVINAQLAAHGFTAAYCDQRPGGGTATAGQGVAVQGPTCPGVTWELKLDSGGTGDDYAIGWDGTDLHSHEWVNGVPLTDPNNDYSSDGGWDIRDCGTCAP